MIVCPLHWYFREAHVKEVMEEMAMRGPPALRGHFDRVTGAFMLREGTHRIRAAHRLGVVPVLLGGAWWRSKKSLDGARFAASGRGLLFHAVDLRMLPQAGGPAMLVLE